MVVEMEEKKETETPVTPQSGNMEQGTSYAKATEVETGNRERFSFACRATAM